MIKMYKTGDGYFWIGGPGEEASMSACAVCTPQGQGPQYDYAQIPLPGIPARGRRSWGFSSPWYAMMAEFS